MQDEVFEELDLELENLLQRKPILVKASARWRFARERILIYTPKGE
jgi:hypothetical protein